MCEVIEEGIYRYVINLHRLHTFCLLSRFLSELFQCNFCKIVFFYTIYLDTQKQNLINKPFSAAVDKGFVKALFGLLSVSFFLHLLCQCFHGNWEGGIRLGLDFKASFGALTLHCNFSQVMLHFMLRNCTN